MKRILVILLALIMVISLFACGKNNEVKPESTPSAEEPESTPSAEEPESDINQSIPYLPEDLPSYEELYAVNEIPANTDWTPVDAVTTVDPLFSKISCETVPLITNDTPLELMMSEFDNVLFAWGSCSDLRNFYPSTIGNPKLEDVLNKDNCGLIGNMPINFLREMGNGGYYTVAKLKNGGYLYYIFAPDSIDTENIYYWGAVYSENNVSYADFSEIKIGDSIDMVIEIDSSAKMALVEHKYHQEVLPTLQFEPFAQVFLLNDGILEITYELADMSTVAHPEFGEEYQIIPITRDELIVSDIKYFSDSIFSSTICLENHGVEQNLHINILPQDYPPEK